MAPSLGTQSRQRQKFEKKLSILRIPVSKIKPSANVSTAPSCQDTFHAADVWMLLDAEASFSAHRNAGYQHHYWFTCGKVAVFDGVILLPQQSLPTHMRCDHSSLLGCRF